MKTHGVSISFLGVATIVGIAWLLGPAPAFAGTRDGGGGIGVFCAAKSPQLQILDLFEAREVKHLSPLLPVGDIKEELFQAELRRYDVIKRPFDSIAPLKVNTDKFIDAALSGSGLIKFVEDGVLKPTTDATLPVLPTGCSFVQIAVNTLNNSSSPGRTIQVSKTYWEMLDATNQAALLLHEMIYTQRMPADQEVLSDHTRDFVGKLFSQNQPTPKFFDMPSRRFYQCMGRNSHIGFFFYQSIVDHRNVISFDQLSTSEIQPWRISFDPGPFDDLLILQEFSVKGPLKSEIAGNQYDFQIFRENNAEIQVALTNNVIQSAVRDSVNCIYIQ